MRNLRWLSVFAGLVLVCLGFISLRTDKVTVYAATGNGWSYEGKEWSYYNNGVRQKSKWIKSDGKWYYINKYGNMTKSLWIQTKDKWYYVNRYGVMATDQWIYYKSNWYYVSDTGEMFYDEVVSIDEKLYYFDLNGVMADSGWIELYDGTYYAKEDGSLVANDVCEVDSVIYCFDENGKLRSSQWFKLNDDTYYCNENGIMLKDKWISYKGKWYYTATDGKRVTGWMKNDNKWYYLDQNGVMQNGWVKDNEKWYYLTKDGVMQTGWLKFNDEWYYLDLVSGAMKTGWLNVNDKVYYLDEGVMVTGWVFVDEKEYYFDINGARHNWGIDVSKWQGDIDWEAVKEHGCNFAIIRISRGLDYIDDKAAYNISECERLGIPYGVYHYSKALTLADAKKEAEIVLDYMKGKNPTLGIWFDMEDNDGYKEDNGINVYEEGELLTNMCMTFCELVKKAGYKTGVYANRNYFKNILDYDKISAKYSIWYARWNMDAPDDDIDCEMWQYSSTGNVSGIEGRVDLDIMW